MSNAVSQNSDTQYASLRISTSETIRALRLSGDLPSASAACEAARAKFPKDYYFAKIQSDLYFELGKYQEAFIALADYLATIPLNKKLIANFANRYYRFRRVLSTEQMNVFASLLNSSLESANLNRAVAQAAKNIVRQDILPDASPSLMSEDENKFIQLLKDDKKFDQLATTERALEKNGSGRLLAILDAHILNRTRAASSFRVDLYCVSIYEKFEQHNKALKVIEELLKVRLESVAIRSLFRICRAIKNYAKVDELLATEPSIVKHDEFNILYELVYYFEAKNDVAQIHGVLKRIENGFAQNLSVLRTLRNFYIRFGMMGDAKRIEPKLLSIYGSKGKESSKFADEAAESDVELTTKIQDLYSQLEHQKQLAAISDLTTGISHELGQPITNIRYTIQFYKKLLQRNLSQENVFKVFDSILEETERMGALIRRLSPLTSSKTVIETFDVVARIQKRIDLEKPRLVANKITVKLAPQRPVHLQGDSTKFDQLVSNLLLNSIDAITEVKEPRKHGIDIKVENGNQDIRVLFSDTGIGIPYKNRNKIFDPFFSTKAPGKGEGLGLFIVWNLLKMQGGRISVDTQHKIGARFIITIPKNTTVQKEATHDK